MSKSNVGKIRFHSKIAVKWLIAGAVFGLILALVTLIIGIRAALVGEFESTFQSEGLSFPLLIVNLFATPLLCSLGWTGWGGVGLLLDGIINYDGRFREIENYSGVWYFYPLIAMFGVLFGLLGLILGINKSRKK